ncbi:MAG: YlmC/YmxH family sporulation protein [Clostridia bacterium]|nr:YlmC/YmxH family sporulation protein [Clostridia bacterium]MBR5786151.1 YlmC/YmxH family sporulation protein [Clostridia bacterium]
MGRVSLFKNNEVVNLSDGRRLGFVSDADVNFETGRLESIMVAGAGKLFGASSKESELIIPFEKIKKIGEDVIIVDIEERVLKYLFR